MNTSKSAPFFDGQLQKLVILPVGSIEQHGPYLPVDTDLRIACMLAEKLESSFSSTAIETILLPAIPFSCSWEHKGLGTLSLNVSTMAAILHDLAKSLKTWNMPTLLLLVNWHGGNDLLASLATEITATEEIPSAVIPAIAYVGKSWDESRITDAKDVHAGAIETSVLQAYWPDLVPAILPKSSHCEPEIASAKVQAVLQALGSCIVTQDGIWGAPEQANAEKGKILIEGLVQKMHDQVNALFQLVNNSR